MTLLKALSMRLGETSAFAIMAQNAAPLGAPLSEPAHYRLQAVHVVPIDRQRGLVCFRSGVQGLSSPFCKLKTVIVRIAAEAAEPPLALTAASDTCAFGNVVAAKGADVLIP